MHVSILMLIHTKAYLGANIKNVVAATKLIFR